MFFLGLWAFGSIYLGWWWPDTHAERTARREQQEHEARMARYLRRDALDELEQELGRNQRDIGVELGNNRTYGVYYSATAWAKNRSVLNESGETKTRELLEDAYRRTKALDERTRERYERASDHDVSNPEWLALSGQERQQLEEALDIVAKARAAVAVLARDAEQ